MAELEPIDLSSFTVVAVLNDEMNRSSKLELSKLSFRETEFKRAMFRTRMSGQCMRLDEVPF